MKNKENLKAFSFKKLLLTILCSIIVTTFILFTAMFVEEIPTWIMSEVMMMADEESEILIYEGKSAEKAMEAFSSKQKEKHGEEYPAEGILVKQVIYMMESGPIVRTYVHSLLLGAILGTIIYIVSVQGAKGKQLVIELFIAFVILSLFILTINLGYKAIINKAINETGATDAFYDTYVYNIESNNIVYTFIVVFAIVYLVNFIRQKILTNKLNKELNNK